jgi:hypothetical protein
MPTIKKCCIQDSITELYLTGFNPITLETTWGSSWWVMPNWEVGTIIASQINTDATSRYKLIEK